jgi:hypothetical protein
MLLRDVAKVGHNYVSLVDIVCNYVLLAVRKQVGGFEACNIFTGVLFTLDITAVTLAHRFFFPSHPFFLGTHHQNDAFATLFVPPPNSFLITRSAHDRKFSIV